jgi:hypothetical protein
MGPRMRLAASSCSKLKSPRMIRNRVKLHKYRSNHRLYWGLFSLCVTDNSYLPNCPFTGIKRDKIYL